METRCVVRGNTRLLMHVVDGIKQGQQKTVIRTVDTDVVVLAISFARSLGCESLVVGKSFRYVDATAIAHVLGDKYKELPVIHRPGVIPPTCFAGRGKRTALASCSACAVCSCRHSIGSYPERSTTNHREVRCCTIRPGQF